MKLNRGFTLIELMIVIAIIAVIAAIAIPNIQRARMNSNEAAAAGNIRSVATGETAYQTSAVDTTLTGVGRFASLASLGIGATPYIDPALASGAKQGYLFEALPVMEGDVPHFTATAIPGTLGVSGIRSYFVDESGVIRFDASGATPSSTSTPLN